MIERTLIVLSGHNKYPDKSYPLRETFNWRLRLVLALAKPITKWPKVSFIQDVPNSDVSIDD